MINIIITAVCCIDLSLLSLSSDYVGHNTVKRMKKIDLPISWSKFCTVHYRPC